MKLIKRTIPLAMVFIIGITMFLSYYIPHEASQTHYVERMNEWYNIIVAFAFLLGLLSLFFTHYGKIKKKVDGWGYSIFVFIGFLAMVIPAFVSGGDLMIGANLTVLGWAYKSIFNTLQATMFSVLAFYIVSTAFRSFRIKSPQAFILFVAAALLILGKVPVGDLIWTTLLGWTGIEISGIVEWIMSVPAVAARRGILIGVSIGAIIISMKIIFGIERQYMGRD
ncbi:MAG: hypothetical protein KAR84_01415 [Elusimicrobiales bacterium]|nr:hypothetical protein [Elusimicrobiales bacterium]MCK5106664.1 hypothetical protein [Elusimicrobiales bacterium]